MPCLRDNTVIQKSFLSVDLTDINIVFLFIYEFLSNSENYLFGSQVSMELTK